MKISTREFLYQIRRGIPEAVKRYQLEIERITGELGGATDYTKDSIQTSSDKLSEEERYTQAMINARAKYLNACAIYEELRSKAFANINNMKSTEMQKVVMLAYIMDQKSWEQIAVDKGMSFESIHNIYYRALEKYFEQYGEETEIETLP